MKKLISTMILGGLLSGLFLSLGGCGKPIEDEFDTNRFSNGGGNTQYFYNGQAVHTENYGKSGYGLVNCAYSSKHDKFSIDMYVPEKISAGAFANASEGVFLEVYNNKGIPTNVSIGINGNQQSKVSAMLPGSVVHEMHHFSTINADSHCNVSVRKVGNTYSGDINCSKLTSNQVGGTLDFRSRFDCDSIANF